jgi:hypothetical protein
MIAIARDAASGAVRVSIRYADDRHECVIDLEADANALDERFGSADLIHALVENQLRGHVEHTTDGGPRYIVTIPIPDSASTD